MYVNKIFNMNHKSLNNFSWAIIDCIKNMLLLMNRVVQQLLNKDERKLLGHVLQKQL